MIENAKLWSHLSNLEQHLSLKCHQFVSSCSQEEASAFVGDKPKIIVFFMNKCFLAKYPPRVNLVSLTWTTFQFASFVSGKNKFI